MNSRRVAVLKIVHYCILCTTINYTVLYTNDSIVSFRSARGRRHDCQSRQYTTQIKTFSEFHATVCTDFVSILANPLVAFSGSTAYTQSRGVDYVSELQASKQTYVSNPLDSEQNSKCFLTVMFTPASCCTACNNIIYVDFIFF